MYNRFFLYKIYHDQLYDNKFEFQKSISTQMIILVRMIGNITMTS